LRRQLQAEVRKTNYFINFSLSVEKKAVFDDRGGQPGTRTNLSVPSASVIEGVERGKIEKLDRKKAVQFLPMSSRGVGGRGGEGENRPSRSQRLNGINDREEEVIMKPRPTNSFDVNRCGIGERSRAQVNLFEVPYRRTDANNGKEDTNRVTSSGTKKWNKKVGGRCRFLPFFVY